MVDKIHETFIGYKANFDLQDCDKILRIKSTTGSIEAVSIINLVKDFGFHAEVFPDEFYSGDLLLTSNLMPFRNSYIEYLS